MARILTDGAEMGDMLFWDYVSSGNAYISTDPASGVYSYYIYRDAYITKSITAISEIYIKFRCKFTDITLTPLQTMKFPIIYNGSTEIAWLQFNGSGYITANAVTIGTLATMSSLLTAGVWYLFEIYFKLNDTTGAFALHIDGVSAINFVGDTKGDSSTTFNKLGFCGGMNYTSPHQGVNVDDLACNDTSGGTDDSWPGIGRVEILKPNADGGTLQWTPSSGSTHYQMVDDIPSNGDSDYLKANAPGLFDYLDLGSFDDTNKSVSRIWVTGRAKDNQAANGQISLGYRVGSTNYMSDPITLSGSYARVAGSESLLNPQTGVPWTKTDLDALQIVLESET